MSCYTFNFPFNDLEIYVYKRCDQNLSNMNIDKIIAKELQSRYLDRVETTLNERGLTFTGLKQII